MDWLNEPPAWRDDGARLTVATGANTDFWRETHYGFVRDSGHLRHVAAPGDFTAEATFGGAYGTLYDQAGLMVRLDERNWVKAGVEFVDGRRLLSCVVTRDFSDWSLAAGQEAPEAVRLRLRRAGTALHVEWRPAGNGAHGADGHEPLRLAHFPKGPARVGPMCCSPERGGFEAWFQDVRIVQPTDLSERPRRAPGGK